MPITNNNKANMNVPNLGANVPQGVKAGFAIGNNDSKQATTAGMELLAPQPYQVKDFRNYFDNTTPINFFNPDLMEEARARNQNGWALAGNSLAQTIGNDIIGGTVSGFGTLLDPRAWLTFFQSGSKAFEGNALTELGSWIQNETNNAFPIYQTQKTQQGFAPGDKTWWASMFPTVASTASALIPTMAVTKFAKYLGEAVGLAEKFSATGKLASEIIANAVMSRHIDGFQSATQTFQQQYQKYKNLGYTDEKAKEAAGDEASSAYRYSWLNLGFDIIQWKYLLGSKGILAGKIDKATAEAMLEKKLITPSGLSKILVNSEKAPSLTTTLIAEGLSEGFDESTMDFFQKEGIRSSHVIKKDGQDDNSTMPERFLHHMLTDRSTWDSFFWGAFGGLFMTGMHKVGDHFLNGNEEDQKNKRLALIMDRAANIRSNASTLSQYIKNGDTINGEVGVANIVSSILENSIQDGGQHAYNEMLKHMANLTPEEAAELGATPEEIAGAKLIHPEFEKAAKIYDAFHGKNYGEGDRGNLVTGLNVARLSYFSNKLGEIINRIKDDGSRQVELQNLKAKFNLPDDFDVAALADLNSPNHKEELMKAFGDVYKSSYIDGITQRNNIQSHIDEQESHIKMLKAMHEIALHNEEGAKDDIAKEELKRRRKAVETDIKQKTDLVSKYTDKLNETNKGLDEISKSIPKEELEKLENLSQAVDMNEQNTGNRTRIHLENLKAQTDEELNGWLDKDKRKTKLKDIFDEIDTKAAQEEKDIKEKISKASPEELTAFKSQNNGKYDPDVRAREKALEELEKNRTEKLSQLNDRVDALDLSKMNISDSSKLAEAQEEVKKNLKDTMLYNIDSNITDKFFNNAVTKETRLVEEKYNKPEKSTNQSEEIITKTKTSKKSIKAIIEELKEDPSKFNRELERYTKIVDYVNDAMKSPTIPAEEKQLLQEVMNRLNQIKEDMEQVSNLIQRNDMSPEEEKFIAKTISFNNKYSKILNDSVSITETPGSGAIMTKIAKDTIFLLDLANTALKTFRSTSEIEVINVDSEEQALLNDLINAFQPFLEKPSLDIEDKDLQEWKNDVTTNIEKSLKIIQSAIKYIEYLTKSPIKTLTYDDVLQLVYNTVPTDQFLNIAKALKQVFNIIETSKSNTQLFKTLPNEFNKINTEVKYNVDDNDFINTWKDKNVYKDTPQDIDFRVEHKNGMSVYLHDLKILDIPENGQVSEEVAKLLSEFYSLVEGSELTLQIDKNHKDDRYTDNEARNADPTKVPISIITKGGIRIGFTNEQYTTHRNISYFKESKKGKKTVMTYHSFIDDLTNKDYELLANDSVMALLKDVWRKEDYTNYNKLSESNALKQLIRKMVYTNRIDDNKEVTDEQVRHVISAIFYRVSNRVIQAYPPTPKMLQEKYNALNIRMKQDFQLVKELRENFANNGIESMPVKVTNVSTGQLKFGNEFKNITEQIKPINGKITIALRDKTRNGNPNQLFLGGMANEGSPFTENRPIKIANQKTIEMDSGSKISTHAVAFAILEANKGSYYAHPIYQSTLNNSQHTKDKDYSKKLIKYVSKNIVELLNSNDTETRNKIWGQLGKYIRLSNTRSATDFSFAFFYKPKNTGKSNLVFKTVENVGGQYLTTFYKIENNNDGTYNVSSTNALNALGKPKFRSDRFKVVNESELQSEITDPVSKLQRYVGFHKVKDQVGVSLNPAEEFVDDVTNTKYTATKDYTAYERFVLNTGAYNTNLKAIKQGTNVITSFFPNGSPSATLFVETSKTTPIVEDRMPSDRTTTKPVIEPEQIVKETKKAPEIKSMSFDEFISSHSDSVKFDNLAFLKDTLKALGIDLKVDLRIGEEKQGDNSSVQASYANGKISIFSSFVSLVKNGEVVSKTPEERGLIIAHEILHSIINEKLKAMTPEQRVKYKEDVETYLKDLESKLENPALAEGDKELIKKYIAISRTDSDEAFTYAFANRNVANILNKIEGATIENKKTNFLLKLINVVLNAMGINKNSELMTVYNIANKYFNMEQQGEEIKTTTPEEVAPVEQSTKKVFKKRNKDATDGKINIDPNKYSSDIDYNNLAELVTNYTTENGLHLC